MTVALLNNRRAKKGVERLFEHSVKVFDQYLADESKLEPFQGEDGIIRFAYEVLNVEELAPYQDEILRAFVRHRKVAVRGLHGMGKTMMASVAILWLVTCHATDVKVVCTASAWRQLTKFLFPEIHKWALQGDWGKIGIEMIPKKNLLDLSIKLPGREAFAAASNNPALLEGAHASVVAYVFDESKAIPDDIWDAAEGAFSTGLAYALAISTPGEKVGRFYEIHRKKPGLGDWWTRHVTLQEAINAGRINPEWVEQKRVLWGEDSPQFMNRVLGEFADAGEDQLIPHTWVEKAIERWHERNGTGENGGNVSYGVDVARYGTDKSAIARLVGSVVEFIRYTTKQSTMMTVGDVAMATQGNTSVPVVVDTVGVGAGVFDRLQELGYNVISFKGGEKTDIADAAGAQGFVNLRSAGWWKIREALDPEGDVLLAIPPDELLEVDLTTPRYEIKSSGRIEVEPKPKQRERTGRSPDGGDAIVEAYYATYHDDYLPISIS